MPDTKQPWQVDRTQEQISNVKRQLEHALREVTRLENEFNQAQTFAAKSGSLIELLAFLGRGVNTNMRLDILAKGIQDMTTLHLNDPDARPRPA